MDNKANSQQPVDDFLQAFNENGWDHLAATLSDVTGEDFTAPDPEFDQACQEIFSTDAGRVVMNSILDATLRSPTWAGPGFLVLPSDKMRDIGLFREGQNSIAAMLIGALRRYHDGQLTETGSEDGRE